MAETQGFGPQIDVDALDPYEVEAERDGKIIRGKDGWLFLAHDTNRILEQHSGELLLSADELLEWRLLLEARVAWLAERGIAYVFMVAPDAHSVYADKLPDEIGAGGERPVPQLVEYLERGGSFARVHYPLGELVAERERNPVYSKTDTHWNDLGGFIAYERLISEIELAGVRARRLARDDIVFGDSVRVGDLGIKMDPVETAPHIFSNIKDRHGYCTFDNRVWNNGRRMDFECPVAPDSKCLVMGDSFIGAVQPYIVESFGKFVFAHNPRLDFELVDELRPDVVVNLMSERFMIVLPYDLPTVTTAELAERKTRAGQVWTESDYADVTSMRDGITPVEA
jgi:hypothetical protein